VGRASQQAGAGLESALDFIHNLYWNRDKVWVQHNGIAGVWRGRPGEERLFHPVSREAAPDYYGCIKGLFVAFDAKTTANVGIWRLKADQIHQRTRLVRLHEAGALTWFAVECREQNVLYLYPPREIEWPSVDFKHPDPGTLQVPWDERVGGYDWLRAVISNWIEG